MYILPVPAPRTSACHSDLMCPASFTLASLVTSCLGKRPKNACLSVNSPNPTLDELRFTTTPWQKILTPSGRTGAASLRSERHTTEGRRGRDDVTGGPARPTREIHRRSDITMTRKLATKRHGNWPRWFCSYNGHLPGFRCGSGLLDQGGLLCLGRVTLGV